MSKNIFTGGEAFGKGLRNATISDTHLVQMLADYRHRVAQVVIALVA